MIIWKDKPVNTFRVHFLRFKDFFVDELYTILFFIGLSFFMRSTLKEIIEYQMSFIFIGAVLILGTFLWLPSISKILKLRYTSYSLSNSELIIQEKENTKKIKLNSIVSIYTNEKVFGIGDVQLVIDNDGVFEKCEILNIESYKELERLIREDM